MSTATAFHWTLRNELKCRHCYISSKLFSMQRVRVNTWEDHGGQRRDPPSLGGTKREETHPNTPSQKTGTPVYLPFPRQSFPSWLQWSVIYSVKNSGTNQIRSNSEVGFSRVLPKVNKSWWGPNLSLIKSAVCLQMHSKCSTNQRSRNGGNSTDHGCKLIRPVESHDQLTYQTWFQSEKQLVCKYTLTSGSISGQEMLEIQQSKNKS